MSSTITFKYRTGATTYSRTLPLLYTKGLDDPDEVEFVPPLQFEAQDGSLIEEIKGFRRIILVRIGILQTAADRQFMLNFLQSSTRWIDIGVFATVHCVLADVTGFENLWLWETKLAPYYEVLLKENVIYQTWPDSLEPVETETLYINTKVEITGTQASPQTLTTNAGVLATDDTGNTYPAINLASWAVTILLTPHQDCLVNRASDITQSGTDITFDVAHADVGNPDPADNKFYATITIGLQAK